MMCICIICMGRFLLLIRTDKRLRGFMMVRRKFFRLTAASLLLASLLQLPAAASQILIDDETAPAATAPLDTQPLPTTASEEATMPEGTEEPETTAPEETNSEATESEETKPEATAPEETMPEATEPKPDPLEGYVFPDRWSKDALIFAVQYGIMVGDTHKNLKPTDSATRAEVTAMILRVMGAQESYDISNFTDVPKGAWYHDSMETAVALGIIKGTTATTLSPNREITRQEAFVLLCRAFGLQPENANAYRDFKDSSTIESYARNAVSALRERGYLAGYTDGTVRPFSKISREEIAAMFYRLFDDICDDPASLPATGDVLYRGAQALPAGLVHDGNLYLACGLSGAQTVETLTVSGDLTLCCALDAEVTLAGCTAQTLSLVTPITVQADGQWNSVKIASGAKITADAAKLAFYGDGTATGTYGNVLVWYGPNVTLNGDMDTLILQTPAEKTKLTVNGNVRFVELCAPGALLNGSGHAKEILNHEPGSVILLSHDSISLVEDKGVTGTRVSVAGSAEVNPGNPVGSFTATFTNVDTGYGMENGKRLCTLKWYVDNTLVKTVPDFQLSEGSTAQLQYTFSLRGNYNYNINVRAELTARNSTVSGQKTVVAAVYTWSYDHALEIVQPYNVEATVTKQTGIYKNQNLTGYIRTLPVGTKMIHSYNPLTGAGLVQLSDGTTGWVSTSSYSISDAYPIQRYAYNLGALEGFVNKKGYKSSTNYLIFVSKKTQMVAVFKKQNGVWITDRTGFCATGTNTTPTRSGVHKLIYKTDSWDFPPDRVYQVSGFVGGQAFHTRLYNVNTGIPPVPDLGYPQSHGCVRIMDDLAKYIHDSIPMNTTVVVY